jgi:excinuclease ABC subunit A
VIFAESQRRYLETLSPYVRQYLQELPRPHVDRVDGLPPSVSLEQRYTSGAKSSTVATVTEVAHYLRLLYARVGLLHCPTCVVEEPARPAQSAGRSRSRASTASVGPAHVPIAPRPLESLVADVAARFGARSVSVLSPAVRAQKGSHRELLTKARDAGVEHARIDGELRPLTRGLTLDRYREHDVELVLGSAKGTSDALRELLRRALREGKGTARVTAGSAEMLLSSERACPSCGRGFPEPDPRFFSFNTKQGACASCEGRGFLEEGKARRNTEAKRITCA